MLSILKKYHLHIPWLWGLLILSLISCQLYGCGLGKKDEYEGVPLDKPLMLPEIELITHTGDSFQFRDLQNETAVIYFGYTFCPDICPMTLWHITQAIDILHEDGGLDLSQLKVYFISVDPERDTPDILGQYVTSFGADYIGLTGELEAIEAAMEPFKVFAEKDEVDGSQIGYLVNHTTRTYFINPRFNTILQYPLEFAPEELSRDIRLILEKEGIR